MRALTAVVKLQRRGWGAARSGVPVLGNSHTLSPVLEPPPNSEARCAVREGGPGPRTHLGRHLQLPSPQLKSDYGDSESRFSPVWDGMRAAPARGCKKPLALGAGGSSGGQALCAAQRQVSLAVSWLTPLLLLWKKRPRRVFGGLGSAAGAHRWGQVISGPSAPDAQAPGVCAVQAGAVDSAASATVGTLRGTEVPSPRLCLCRTHGRWGGPTSGAWEHYIFWALGSLYSENSETRCL